MEFESFCSDYSWNQLEKKHGRQSNEERKEIIKVTTFDVIFLHLVVGDVYLSKMLSLIIILLPLHYTDNYFR